jgi:putative zinc finger protein
MLDSTDCAARRAAIVEYIAGTLAEGERPQIAAHLAGCATCLSEATFWRASLAALEDADGAPPDTGAAAGWQALRERLGAHSALGEVKIAGRATESGMSPAMPETTSARAGSNGRAPAIMADHAAAPRGGGAIAGAAVRGRVRRDTRPGAVNAGPH